MAKAVLIQNDGSHYRDEPGVRYHLPNRLLQWARQAQGDWVLLYRGRRGGTEGYFGVQRASKVVADPADPNSSYLLLDPASELSFEQVVPRLKADRTSYETGLPRMGGFNTQAIRIISDRDFAAIVAAGLRAATVPEALPREGALHPGLSDGAVPFDPTPMIRERELTSRAFRDATFARQVKTAYAARCAMSGLALRNGGGRPEVEAAHIRSVEAGGPDVVRNGLALSGTLHWMFDRGLVSVDEDHSILIARDSIASEVADRLLTPDRKLILPPDPVTRPHPAYLEWHRRAVFKG